MKNGLAGRLVRDGIISQEEEDIVIYGLENMIGTAICGLIMLGIGLCFGNILDGFLLWIIILPLRKHAGGFHAKTRIRCLTFSIGIIIAAFALLYQISWPTWFLFVITVVFGSIIFLLAPIDNPNKRLSEIERNVYRKRTHMFLIAEGSLYVIAYVFVWKRIDILITMSVFIVGIALLAGKMSANK